MRSLDAWPPWTRDAGVQRGLELFADDLVRLNVSRGVVVRYVGHVARGWSDVEGYIRSLRSWQGVQHAKFAFQRYATWKRRPDLIPAIKALPEPIRPPRRPVHVPDLETWRQLGPKLLRANPGPMGHILWCLVYSGLRIGDLLSVRREEAAQAAGGAEAVVRQKGGGGAGRERRRRWRPAADIRPALACLVREPGWDLLHRIVSASIDDAADTIRSKIPPPQTPHDFRRAFATYHYAMFPDLLMIAEMGGWESTASVERYIVHIPAERIAFVQRRMSALLFPDGTPYSRAGA